MIVEDAVCSKPRKNIRKNLDEKTNPESDFLDAESDFLDTSTTPSSETSRVRLYSRHINNSQSRNRNTLNSHQSEQLPVGTHQQLLDTSTRTPSPTFSTHQQLPVRLSRHIDNFLNNSPSPTFSTTSPSSETPRVRYINIPESDFLDTSTTPCRKLLPPHSYLARFSPDSETQPVPTCPLRKPECDFPTRMRTPSTSSSMWNAERLLARNEGSKIQKNERNGTTQTNGLPHRQPRRTNRQTNNTAQTQPINFYS